MDCHKVCQNGKCKVFIKTRLKNCGKCGQRQTAKPKKPVQTQVTTTTTALKNQMENNARKLAEKDHDTVIFYRSWNAKPTHYSMWGSKRCEERLTNHTYIRNTGKTISRSYFVEGMSQREDHRYRMMLMSGGGIYYHQSGWAICNTLH